MKKVLYTLICISLLLNSCDNVEPENDSIVYDELAVQEFSNFISSNSNQLKGYINRYNSIPYEANSEMAEGQNAEDLLKSIIEPSKRFLIKSGFTEEELINEFGNIESPEVVIVAITTLAKLEYDNSKGGSIKAPRLENSIMKCLGSASGMKGLWDIATGAAAASRAAILRAVGRVASRHFGWIGAALFIGEFIQCYWGENSSFD